MKTAIVTGGTKGIGLSITKKLLENDYCVIAIYANDNNNAQTIKQELEALYSERIIVIQQIMEYDSDICQFIDKIEQMGILSNGLDALILNAGCTDRTRWNELTWDKWMHVMNVNINAPAALVRSLDKYLNRDASIIFISSDMSIYPHATSVPYTVSKSAVNGLATSLVKEYSDRRIRVNAILPGFVETPWQREKPADQKQRICDKVALHRFASPDEIGDVVINVMHSTYINGALIKVDGGYCYK